MIDRMAPAGRVTTQEVKMVPITRRLSAAIPRAMPTSRIEPTRVQDVSPGRAVADQDTGQSGGVRDRPTQAEGTDHGGGGVYHCGKPADGGQFGDVLAYGGDDPVAVGDQTHHNAQGAQQQYPARHGGLRL